MRAIVELAQALDLPVVAEGIEVPGQAEELLRLGCGLGQGFYFAKPLEARELERFVRADSEPATDGVFTRMLRRKKAA